MGRFASFTKAELEDLRKSLSVRLEHDWSESVYELMNEIYGEFARRGL